MVCCSFSCSSSSLKLCHGNYNNALWEHMYSHLGCKWSTNGHYPTNKQQIRHLIWNWLSTPKRVLYQYSMRAYVRVLPMWSKKINELCWMCSTNLSRTWNSYKLWTFENPSKAELKNFDPDKNNKKVYHYRFLNNSFLNRFQYFASYVHVWKSRKPIP